MNALEKNETSDAVVPETQFNEDSGAIKNFYDDYDDDDDHLISSE